MEKVGFGALKTIKDGASTDYLGLLMLIIVLDQICTKEGIHLRILTLLVVEVSQLLPTLMPITKIDLWKVLFNTFYLNHTKTTYSFDQYKNIFQFFHIFFIEILCIIIK